jgi:hypothetical protein
MPTVSVDRRVMMELGTAAKALFSADGYAFQGGNKVYKDIIPKKEVSAAKVS